MALKLSEFQDEINANVGESTFYDSRIIVWLNLIQDRIKSKFSWPALQVVKAFNTVDGDGDYVISSGLSVANFDRMLDLFLVDGTMSRRLEYTPIRVFDTVVPSPAALAEGRPEFYTIKNDTIVTYPIPDAIYAMKLWYIKDPTAFAAASPTAVCTIVGIDELLILYGTSKAWLAKREYEQAKTYKILGDVALGEIISDKKIQEDYTPKLAGINLHREHLGDDVLKGRTL